MTTFTIRRTLRAAAITLLASLALPMAPASSGVQQAQLEHVFATSNWSKPSTDPSGLAYFPGRKALIVVDSEVEETSHYGNANMWFWKPGVRVIKALKTTAYSMEPTDIAIAAGGKTLYVTDDSADRVFAVRKGPDERWGTADDNVLELMSRNFQSRDPAGVGFGAKSLFVTDGDNTTSDHRVYRLRPGQNGVIDGAAPQGDDFVTFFDTLPLGITKPSDIVFQPGTRHLFIVSADEDIIAEATLKGALVATYDMSHTALISAAGIAFAPSSDDPQVMHLYVADRGKDNDQDPAENDGRVFEFSL